MDDITINELLQSQEKLSCFKGVFGKNEIKNIEVNYYPSCYVFNEGDFGLGKGTHWIAIYVDEDGSVDYYDSYGKLPLAKEIKGLVKGFDRFNYNSKQVQSYYSSVCGQHCIFFLVKRHKGQSLDFIVNNYFNDSLTFNDNYVKRFVEEKYDV